MYECLVEYIDGAKLEIKADTIADILFALQNCEKTLN